ncbi:DUF7546 family protein [Salinirubrum litoreum]|uniref:Uncharacterized protein n=1 Tax=Salinirubrum litoreum TaxID=1126234 RepID=A0ABD5RG46_9EURY|nr:ABC transporter ATP-binding protein [Salinirubrum litoreum]
MSTRLAAVTRPFRATGLPPRRLAVALAGLVGVEALLLLAWLWVSPGDVTAPRYLLYPFVWIDASLLAAALVLGDARGRQESAGGRPGAVAVLVGVGYAVLLLWAGGLIGRGGGSGALTLLTAPPGWGPIILYDGAVRLAVVPFKLIGYLVLAWLVALVVGAAGRPLVSGALGLVTCVGCTGPLILALVAALGGGSVTAYAAVSDLSYDLSTVVFLVSLVGVTWSVLRSRH